MINLLIKMIMVTKNGNNWYHLLEFTHKIIQIIKYFSLIFLDFTNFGNNDDSELTKNKTKIFKIICHFSKYKTRNLLYCLFLMYSNS